MRRVEWSEHPLEIQVKKSGWRDGVCIYVGGEATLIRALRPVEKFTLLGGTFRPKDIDEVIAALQHLKRVTELPLDCQLLECSHRESRKPCLQEEEK